MLAEVVEYVAGAEPDERGEVGRGVWRDRVVRVRFDPRGVVKRLEPPCEDRANFVRAALAREPDRFGIVFQPVEFRPRQVTVSPGVPEQVFQTADHDHRVRQRVRDVHERVDRGPELIARLDVPARQFDHLVHLIDQQHERGRVDRAHQLAQAGDRPQRHLRAGPRYEAAEHLAVVGRQVLAPQPVQHLRADAPVVGQ